MSTNRLTTAEVNIAAEVRAVEEGHRAMLAADHHASVLSDTTPGLHWLVTGQAPHAGAGIMFHCVPDGAVTNGHGDRWSRTPGRLCCKHAAVLVRRLEREGLAAFVDGVWVATDRAVVRYRHPADLFAGLERMAS